jgi:hypothetical protein
MLLVGVAHCMPTVCCAHQIALIGCAVDPSSCRAAQPGFAGNAIQNEAAAVAAADAAQQQEYGSDLTRHDIAAAYQQTGRPNMLQQPRRPEYALFLACMAWLHHTPDRQQYKQQLYECFDFNAMLDNELSQVRARLTRTLSACAATETHSSCLCTMYTCVFSTCKLGRI